MAVEFIKLVEAVERTYFSSFAVALQDMLAAYATNDRDLYVESKSNLEDSISDFMSLGELIGAADQLKQSALLIDDEDLEIEQVPSVNAESMSRWWRNDSFEAFAYTPLKIANLEFEEAAAEIESSVPRVLVGPWERAYQRISNLYGKTKGGVIAFAKAAEQSVVEKAKSVISKAIKEGWGEDVAGRAIVSAVDKVRVETEAWTEAYARMAFRTNLNTATTKGRFRQAQDPAIKKILPAFRFDSVGDADTRENHQAADGLIFSVDNPVWNKIAPPLGYSCRCTIAQVSIAQLKRMGRIDSKGRVIEDRLPPSAHPDPGFKR